MITTRESILFRRGCAAVSLAAAAGCGLTLATAATAQAPLVEQTVYYDFVNEAGFLDGGRALVKAADMSAVAGRSARASNSADNRVDLVFVGDGYVSSELPLYHQHVDSVLASLFGLEPFAAYEPYFRVHEIDVVSNESGVSGDPTPDVSRDTALGMTFWCSGIERLLCVNVGAAYSFANQAPDVDQVIAVANTTKYGGAGYPSSNLGTLAGGNGLAADIAIHELGHSLGNLADEYTYGGPTTYTGPERPEANVSIYDAVKMQTLGTKWADWLGSSDARFDSPVTAIEGAYYSQFGVYRPTNNSMMRSLGRRFNAVSAEALIKEIYREVSPIDAHTANDSVMGSDSVLEVTPMQPIGHSLDVTWRLDGALVAQDVNALDLSTLSIAQPAAVTVEVVDNTDMVRDAAIRANFLTASVSWTVEPSEVCVGDVDGDGFVNGADLVQLLGNFGGAASGPAEGDLDGSGTVDGADLVILLGAFAEAC